MFASFWIHENKLLGYKFSILCGIFQFPVKDTVVLVNLKFASMNIGYSILMPPLLEACC